MFKILSFARINMIVVSRIRAVVNHPLTNFRWYVTNQTLHADIGTPFVSEVTTTDRPNTRIEMKIYQQTDYLKSVQRETRKKMARIFAGINSDKLPLENSLIRAQFFQLFYLLLLIVRNRIDVNLR